MRSLLKIIIFNSRSILMKEIRALKLVNNKLQMAEHKSVEIILLLLQLALFTLGRLLDDMSWYDVGVANEVNVFQGVGVAGMTICAILQFVRKSKYEQYLRILLVKSQLKFIIPWALITTICLLFFNIFGCQSVIPADQEGYFYVDYTGCCLNITQIVLTNLNYSLVCNTKTHRAELFLYELVLFGEVIYNGNLLMLFINNLEGKVKDYSILLISLMIANQILIMDLIFRAAYEDREREEEQEVEKSTSSRNRIAPEVGSMVEISSPVKN